MIVGFENADRLKSFIYFFISAFSVSKHMWPAWILGSLNNTVVECTSGNGLKSLHAGGVCLTVSQFPKINVITKKCLCAE
jgi:hypothetical protein